METLPASSNRMAAKAEEIRRVLSEPVVDLWKLRDLALTEGGLVNDSLRKLAWPKLVGVHDELISTDSPSAAPSCANVEDAEGAGQGHNRVPPSVDAEQIDRDVSRVTWHLLTGNQRSRNLQMKNRHRKRVARLLRKKQRRLGDFVNLTLVRSYEGEEEEDWGAEAGEHRGEIAAGGTAGSPSDGGTFVTTCPHEAEGGEDSRLRYYQGYHDVASIVLSAMGGASVPLPPAPRADQAVNASDRSPHAVDELASSMGLTMACRVLLRLSRSHLRDALRSNFCNLQLALRLVVMPLLGAFDAELHSHLVDCDMEPYFCLSWVITWFAHDVRDTALVKRMYDFFLVSHPLMSLYVSVAMMIHPLNRIEVLGADCDFACVHHALADLPKNSSDVGWKYLPGERGANYVTGDEEEEDGDLSLMDQSHDEDDDVSVLFGGGRNKNRARVPFQELVDLSLSLMHKIPPRNLIHLARRYHTEITLKPLMTQVSTIALLQSPPSWGLASYAESDWVLKTKMRNQFGLTKLNRHQRKNRLKQQEFGIASTTAIVKHNRPAPARAIIAAGTGPDGLAEERGFRKKRRMLVQSVAIVLLSVFVVLARDYFSHEPTPARAVVAHSSRPQQAGEDQNGESVNEGIISQEDEAMHVQRAQNIKMLKSDPSTDEVKEQEISSPQRKKNQMNNLCDNDDAAAMEGVISAGVELSVTSLAQEEQLSLASTIAEVTPEVHNSKNSIASMEDKEKEKTNEQREEPISDVHVNKEDSAVAKSSPHPDPLEDGEKELEIATVLLSVFVVLARDYLSQRPVAAALAAQSSRPWQAQQQQTKGDLLMGEDEAHALLAHVDFAAITADTKGIGRNGKSVNEGIILQEEDEAMHVQRAQNIKTLESDPSTDEVKEQKISSPKRKKKQMNDLCNNDDAAAVSGLISAGVELSVTSLVQEEQLSLASTIAEVTPEVHSSKNIIASMEDREKGKTNKQREEPIRALEDKNIKCHQPSPSATEETKGVLMKNSMLVAKNALLQLDELEKSFEMLMLRLMDTLNAARVMLEKALKIGWHRMIIEAARLNRIAAPVLKEELIFELEGASPEWSEDARKAWKNQELLMKNQGKLFGKLVKVGKESLSKWKERDSTWGLTLKNPKQP